MSANLDASAEIFVLSLPDERPEAELDQSLSDDRDRAGVVACARDRLLPWT